MNSVNQSQYVEDTGPFEARYLAFLETISTLRPALHRYCARMTGSVMDGEDVVQESLFEAYRKLDQFDQGRPLKPWLFRIAHNRCIDFLRRRGVRDEAEVAAALPGRYWTNRSDHGNRGNWRWVKWMGNWWPSFSSAVRTRGRRTQPSGSA
jgi:DNA-directed RNA polymerase specialized sigma24 family protein